MRTAVTRTRSSPSLPADIAPSRHTRRRSCRPLCGRRDASILDLCVSCTAITAGCGWSRPRSEFAEYCQRRGTTARPNFSIRYRAGIPRQWGWPAPVHHRGTLRCLSDFTGGDPGEVMPSLGWRWSGRVGITAGVAGSGDPGVRGAVYMDFAPAMRELGGYLCGHYEAA